MVVATIIDVTKVLIKIDDGEQIDEMICSGQKISSETAYANQTSDYIQRRRLKAA